MTFKSVIWLGSTLDDLREFPEPVQDHFGYALYVAQLGAKHRDAKVLAGFGGAAVVEVIKDYRSDAFRAGVYAAKCRCSLCVTRVSEEIEDWTPDAPPRHGTNSATPQGSRANFKEDDS